MASKARINEMAEDIKRDYGALITITDIMRYLKCGRGYAWTAVQGLNPVGVGTGKKYFYKDVAEAILDGNGQRRSAS